MKKEEMKLKICPFCGGEAKIKKCLRFRDLYNKCITKEQYYIKCDGCGIETEKDENVNKLIMFWNVRKGV